MYKLKKQIGKLKRNAIVKNNLVEEHKQNSQEGDEFQRPISKTLCLSTVAVLSCSFSANHINPKSYGFFYGNPIGCK